MDMELDRDTQVLDIFLFRVCIPQGVLENLGPIQIPVWFWSPSSLSPCWRMVKIKCLDSYNILSSKPGLRKHGSCAHVTCCDQRNKLYYEWMSWSGLSLMFVSCLESAMRRGVLSFRSGPVPRCALCKRISLPRWDTWFPNQELLHTAEDLIIQVSPRFRSGMLLHFFLFSNAYF